jgi:MFS family permease
MTGTALDSYGWRIAFLIGAITLPFGLWMRSGLPETLHLPETGTVMAQMPSKSGGLIRANARVFMLGLLILASGTIITYVTEYMTTYAEDTLHVSTDLAFATNVISNGVGLVAALYGGWLADRVGRWPVMVWPQLTALLLTYPIFLWIVDTRSALALLGGLAILSAVGTVPYSAFLRSTSGEPAEEYPRRRLCDYLCCCHRLLRRHRTIDCHLADTRNRQCDGAGLVHAIRNCRRPCGNDDDARNRAGEAICQRKWC